MDERDNKVYETSTSPEDGEDELERSRVNLYDLSYFSFDLKFFFSWAWRECRSRKSCTTRRENVNWFFLMNKRYQWGQELIPIGYVAICPQNCPQTNPKFK